ncbi:MAG: aldehyde dehydrogenase family protein [Candidatus Omnitrophica bacterium]|nr:aldehyde dehydrogenase family protein [Candidatus Omnitrophota bacterium]
MKKFTLLLNGKDLDTGTYDYFPYTDKKIGDFEKTFRILTQLKMGKLSEDSVEANEFIYAKYCIGKDDTNKSAIESAYKAYKKFRKFPLSSRKKIFLDMYKLLLEKKEEFIKILITEGHPRKLAEWEFEGMQIGSSPETIDYYCKQIQKEIGRHDNEILYLTRRPDGVICASPPGNASASNSYNAILAFLVGNALVIKPPLRDPVSTIFLWKEVVNEALVSNNAPPGTLNIILGNSKTIMDEWLDSQYVNDIIFFGDSKKGLEIGAKIFQSGKKPILELSGNDLFLVWKDADIEKSTDSLLDSFLGSKQICMVPKVALIHQSIYEKFSHRFLEKVKGLKISLPSDPDTILSPVVKIKEFFDFLNDSLENGAKLIYGGERVNHFDLEDKRGVFIRPAILEINDCDKALEMRCVKEEIFFPLLPLIRVSGQDEDIFEKIENTVNAHGYGLRVSLWISSAKYLRKFAKQLDNCGLLRINSRHVGFSFYLSTHGGTKKSGGPFGEMNYFWQKTSHLQGVCRTRIKTVSNKTGRN